MMRRALVRQVPLLATRRLHTTPRVFASRDPGGKPNDGSHRTVYDDFYNILQDSPSSVDAGQASVTISSMSETSFTLNDGLVVSTPMIVVNGQVFMWDAPELDQTRAAPSGVGWEAWALPSDEKDLKKKYTEAKTVKDLWKVLELVDDRPEILLFGTGKTVLPPPAHVRRYINSLGIQLDVQSTRNACSTFNLLAEEGRKVAVAALPNQRTPIEKITPEQLARHQKGL